MMLWRSAIVCGLLALGAAAFATDIGQDAARRLKREGKIVALGAIVAEINARWPGRVIETELERDDGGRYVYEIELLGDDGHVYEFEYDAGSGQRLGFERER
ncbi:MAG: PepSY domain-containing protein [Gammaproteobacteria bacterium]